MADSKLSAGQEWLVALLKLLQLPADVHAGAPATLESQLEVFGQYWLTLEEGSLTPEQRSLLLDHNGAALDALQYLINATLNMGKPHDDQVAYTVELSQFREKRYSELAQMADAAADQVRNTGESVAMEPLPPAERRLIHTILSDAEDLETASEGQEPERHLVVSPRSA